MPRDPGPRPSGARTTVARPAVSRPAVNRAPATQPASRAATPEKVLAGLAPSPIPFDRAAAADGASLDALAGDLAAAGRRARSRKAQATAARPDPTFADGLRSRLLMPAAVAEPAGPAGSGALAGPAPRAGTVRLAKAAPLAGLARGELVSDGPPDARPGPLSRPRTSLHAGRTTRRSTSLRTWGVLGIGLVILAVAAAGLASGRFTPIAANRAGDAAEATLVRSGSSQALVAGTGLSAGDEIRVAAGGHATLLLGSSQARLAGGADVRLNTLSSSAVQVALLAGRAYSRVILATGGTYAVVTGPYTWTATGTAFDLDRTAAATGGEQVTLLDLEHGVAVDGPTTHQQVAEGSAMTVLFGNPATAGMTVGPIPASVFADPWLINNAKTDESLGYPIGALAGVALAPNDTPSATPSPSPTPTDPPTPSPSPSQSPSSAPSDSPSPMPTPAATATPTPTATPSPSPSATATPQPSLSLGLTSCPGGVVLSWSKYAGTGFARYVTLRSSSLNIPKAYPPQAGAVVVSGSSTTVLSRTSAADGSIGVGATEFYRTLALGAGDKVLAASDVRSGLGFAPDDMTGLAVDNGYVVWPRFDKDNTAPPGCFSRYRVFYSTDPDPTAGPFKTIDVTSELQSNISIPSNGWSHGQTFYFQVEALKVTALGTIMVGQTDIQAYFYP